MSGEANTGGASTTSTGGSTAGLREAALAKGRPTPEAKPEQPQRAANDNGGDSSERPQFRQKPTPAADAEARAAKKKLPSNARAEADEAAEIAAALEGDDEPADTIRIGDHDVPFSALEGALSDDVLKRVKRKLKVGGEDIETTLEEALRLSQQGRDYMNKTRKLSAAGKQLEGIAKRLREDPIGALTAMGASRAEAMDIIARGLVDAEEYDRLDPKQRAERERIAALERSDVELKRMRAEEKRQRDGVMLAKAKEQGRARLTKALEGAGLSGDDYMIGRTASIIAARIEAGDISGDPTDDDIAAAVQHARGEHDQHFEAWLPDTLDGDALVKRLGQKRARAIARAYAKSVAKQAAPVQRGDAKPRTQPAANDNGAQMSDADWRRQANERMRRKWGGR